MLAGGCLDMVHYGFMSCAHTSVKTVTIPTLSILDPYIPVLHGFRKRLDNRGLPGFIYRRRSIAVSAKTIFNIRRNSGLKFIIIGEIGANGETIDWAIGKSASHARSIDVLF